MNTITHLIDLAVQYGGSIISADTLQPYELDQAEASNRLYSDANGHKLIWTPDIEDFPSNDDEVEFFERWYPLEMEVPDGLLEKIMVSIENERDVLKDNHYKELVDTLQSIVDCAENDPDGIVSRTRIMVAKELLSKINS